MPSLRSSSGTDLKVKPMFDGPFGLNQGENMEEVFAKIFEIAKIILPWITGGLAGAILTYFLNRRMQNKNNPELTIESSSMRYELAETDTLSSKLLVSYGSNNFEKLSYIKYTILNTGNISIDNAFFSIEINDYAQIIDKSIITSPLKNQATFKETDALNIYNWETKEFKPGDTSSIFLLVNNQNKFNIHWRGIDNVRMIDKSEKPRFFDTRNDISNLTFIFVFAIAIRSFPLIGSSLQAIFLLFSAPYLTQTVTKYIENRSSKK